jgi:inorganic pyrophosphatase
MNLEEIQQAITELSPDELSRFREWFKKYESNINSGELRDSKEIRETLRRLRGSLKGKGVLKTLMEERRKESLL